VLVTSVARRRLLQFGVVHLGLSLLASAIASVLVASPRSCARRHHRGIELSIAALRIRDVVVFRPTDRQVRNLLHLVVVRLWDCHRLIVPVTRDGRQNWTDGRWRGSSPRSCGSISVPMEDLGELPRPLRKSPHWDRRRSTVQVVNVGNRAMLVRGVASVDDASRAFDLRCELRGLGAFVRELEDGRYFTQGRVRSLDPVAEAEAPLQAAQGPQSQSKPSKVSSASSSADPPKAG
jgi:hypothetical protein